MRANDMRVRLALLVLAVAPTAACNVEWGPSETITAITIEPHPFTLIVGETRLRPTAYFVNDWGSFPVDTARWEIADTSIARLTSDRQIVAGATPGTTTLIARSGKFSAVIALDVKSNYFVWPSGMRLIPGASRKVVLHAEHEAVGREVAQSAWESSNPAVATVASDGTVTALANGEVTITARRGAYTATAQVLVASYANRLVFTDFALSPRGICATEGSGTWCWGGEHGDPVQSVDRCASVTFPQTTISCAASPILLTPLKMAELVSVRADNYAPILSEPVGPYGRTADGKLFHLGPTGPAAYQPALTFKTFWAGRPMCGADQSGKGFCWNTNFDGYMGVGNAQQTGPWPQTPTPVISDQRFTQFVRGESMCALAEDGAAHCWGPNRNLGAGIGPIPTAQAPGCYSACVLVPTPTATSARFVMLAGGGSSSPFGGGVVCGLTASGQLYCWSAQLTANGSPVLVPGRTFVRIESGASLCGIEASGDAYCLPAASGSIETYSFTKVPLPFPVTRIVFGYNMACAMAKIDARLYCWGSGALGGGNPVATATAQNPVEVWGQR
jgi:hypothetical protein